MQYSHCTYDTAQALGAGRPGRTGWARGVQARWAQAGGLCTFGRAAGPVGCALGALSLFFDSVLFLSHRLDTVREHCSSQKKFFKNYLIK